MARDAIHYSVKQALINDGWLITHDPYPIKLGGFEMEIDLGAETVLAAERENAKIAIEIKTFSGLSKVYEFHLVVGQYVDYRIALHAKEPERVLYLAITEEIYAEVFNIPFVQLVIQSLNMKLIIVNTKEKKVSKWID